MHIINLVRTDRKMFMYYDLLTFIFIVYIETIPAESARSMNISKKFLEILQLSFEAKYIGKDIKFSKKRSKIKAVEDRMDMLYRNVIDISTNPKFDDIVALAAAYYNIGLEYVNSTHSDDLNMAIICFSRCLELLQGKQLDRKAILTSIGALNELNLVCEKVDKETYTYKFLNTALELYLKYTMKDNYPNPVHIASLVGIKEKESNPKIILDIFHYTTLQDLAIHYLTKPKDKHGFVMYIHKMLNIRLAEMVSQGTQFDEKCLDWALTLYDLSRYFLVNGRFAEARSHIVTADYTACRFFKDKLAKIEEKSKAHFNHLFESYDYVCAISNRSWGSYGVYFLRFWMERFLQNKGNGSYELEELVLKLNINSEKEKSNLLIFSDLEEELERVTNQITETYVLNLADAKSVFVKTLRHLDTAKEYFTADTDIESYAKIILETSQTYKYLAGFEEEKDKRIKLHKRRVECLEDVCKKFSTIIDTDTELQIFKQIWYEVVTSCSTIMDLMLEETYDESFKEMSTEADRYAKLILKNIDLYLNVI